MGRIEANAAGLPQKARGVPFREPEVDRLIEEVQLRREIIYGTNNQPPLPRQVKLAWQEIAAIISSLSTVERSADQCRKRFNDIKRRGTMMVAGRKRGRPPKNVKPNPKFIDIIDDIDDIDDIDTIQAILESNRHVEPEDLEFEVQAPMDDDDPDYEPTPKKRESLKITAPKDASKSAQFASSPKPPSKTPSLPKPKIPSLPKLKTPSLSKSLAPTLMKIPISSLPKSQAPSLPKPLVPSQAKLQVPPQAKPQTPSQTKPQTKPQTASQTNPQTPSQTNPQTPSQTNPQTPSQTKPQAPSQTKPKIIVVRKSVGSSDPAARRQQQQHQQQQDDERHPFLELQQAGFDMLQRELSGFRDSVMSLNTRLNHLEVALRPIGHISDSLARIATAVERLTSPPE